MLLSEYRTARFTLLARGLDALGKRGSRDCRKRTNTFAGAMVAVTRKALFERDTVPHLAALEPEMLQVIRLRCCACPHRCKAPVT